MDLNIEAGWLERAAGVRAVREECVVRVGGDDAVSWLQGQVSNDVERLAVGTSCYALVVGLNGKVRSDVWVHRRADHLLLVLPRSVHAEILAHFDKYIIMEDVELEPLDSHIMTVQGPSAGEIVANEPVPLPAARLGNGWDVLVPAAEADARLRALAARAEAAGGGEVSFEGWELARIRAGRPRFGMDFGDFTLPQEAGLETTAVSFEKGCYVGQEPVVMLQHRGKPPKRLGLWRSEDGLVAGQEIVLEDGTRVGRVTSPAPAPEADGSWRSLGLVKRAAAEQQGTFRIEGREVTLLHLVGGPGKLP